MKDRLAFTGTGGQLFSLILGQTLLSIITLGIYIPWATVKITKYFAEHTEVGGKAASFSGTGGAFFSLCLIQTLRNNFV